jgi:hypothetical protein
LWLAVVEVDDFMQTMEHNPVDLVAERPVEMV